MCIKIVQYSDDDMTCDKQTNTKVPMLALLSSTAIALANLAVAPRLTPINVRAADG